MADPGNLYLRGSEAKIIHAASYILILESVEAARKDYQQGKPFARLRLVVNGATALLSGYLLYTTLRHKPAPISIFRSPFSYLNIFRTA